MLPCIMMTSGTLFAAALERYLDHFTRARVKRLQESLPPKQAVRRFIEEIIERTVNDRERRGCFLINSALEIAPHDKELGAVIADRLGEIDARNPRTARRAVASGELSPAVMLWAIVLGFALLLVSAWIISRSAGAMRGCSAGE